MISPKRMPLSEDLIFNLLDKHTTFCRQIDDNIMVMNRWGHEMCAQRFVDFVREIEHIHGITKNKDEKK